MVIAIGPVGIGPWQNGGDAIAKLGPKISILESSLRDLSSLDHVGDARNKGMIAGIELVRDKISKEPYPLEEKRGWEVVSYAR